MGVMTEHHPDAIARVTANEHDYLPAAGRHAFLPGYDLLTRLLGMPKNYDKLSPRPSWSTGYACWK